MNEQMEFPETFEKFAKEYGFKDAMQVYTYGSDLIPVFRVKQWIEHNNKLHAIETDTGKQIPFDNQEPKTGHWIFKNDNIAIPTGYYQCSECGCGKALEIDNYCPNCGAKMDWFEIGSDCHKYSEGLHIYADGQVYKVGEDDAYQKELNDVRRDLLSRPDQYIAFRDLVERFDEVDEEFDHSPWNLLQIYNNFNIFIGTESEVKDAGI